MGPLPSDSMLLLTPQPSKHLLPSAQAHLSSHCSWLLCHCQKHFGSGLLVSFGKPSDVFPWHSTVPDLALWNLICLPTLGFLSQRGKVETPPPITYFPDIIISLVDNGQAFKGRRGKHSLPLSSFWGNSFCFPR